MKKLSVILFMSFLLLALSSCTPGPNFVVNSPGDEQDNNVGDGKCQTANNSCTLRAALMEANHTSDVNQITFQGVSMIQPLTPLPRLMSGGTQIYGNGAVTLDGSLVEDEINNGLVIFQSSYNIIQGLVIQHFDRGISIQANNGYAGYNRVGLVPGNPGDGSERNIIIWNGTGVQIRGANASQNSISGNHFGTGPGGNGSRPNEFYGISLSAGAHHNLIGSLVGSPVNQGGNLISSNNVTGIQLQDSFYNHISGNYIGVKIGGTQALPNGEGIEIGGGAFNVIGIGPGGDGIPNLISGNQYDGVIIGESDHNIVAGNLIGTNASGTASVPNRIGVHITLGSSMNTIGTDGDGTADSLEGNLISGNAFDGIVVSGTTTIKNVIAGNLIGTDLGGSNSLGNGLTGVTVSGDMTLIGTNGDGISDVLERNIISGNGTTGVILNAFSAIVAGNFIGTDQTGMDPLGNTLDGVMINTTADGCRIGTNGDGLADIEEGNVISGNGLAMNGNAGITIHGDGNTVAGNYIGTNASGSAGIGNLQDGIQLTSSASSNLIGTDGDGSSDVLERNLVSGNGRFGVWLLGAYLNTVSGNYLGTDLSGTAAIPNGHAVISSDGALTISGGASGNIIGTNSDLSNDAIEGNLISGNNLKGISIHGASTHSNIIAGNKVGTNASGTAALANQLGVEIRGGAYLNQLGTDGDGISDFMEKNLISGNSGFGIYLMGADNQIAGNYIGTDISGVGDVGNGHYGIYVADGASDNIIGGNSQKTNIIAFHERDGIYVTGSSTSGIMISANSIFSNEESGIDLQDESDQGSWFSPNDPGDLDTGPNGMMNFPELSSASTVPPSIGVSGLISNGLANTNFLIEFFSNETCDSPSAHGEGKTYLGSSSVTTDNSGNAAISANLSAVVNPGSFITATATAGNQTSEFSNCVEVTAGSVYYSAEINQGRCGLFDQQEVTVVTSEVDPEKLYVYLYAKNTSGFPGLDYLVPEDQDPWEYSAIFGEVESIKCGSQGIEGRLYCDFYIPENYLNSAQDLKIFVNLCLPPIFLIEDVSIFVKEKTCTSDLNAEDCRAAGGNYQCVTTCKCSCP